MPQAQREGILLILIGVFLIGLINNLLRPTLVGGETKMPDFVELISTLGGLQTFGVDGLPIGPLPAALFISTCPMLTHWRHAGAPDEPSGGEARRNAAIEAV